MKEGVKAKYKICKICGQILKPSEFEYCSKCKRSLLQEFEIEMIKRSDYD